MRPWTPSLITPLPSSERDQRPRLLTEKSCRIATLGRMLMAVAILQASFQGCSTPQRKDEASRPAPDPAVALSQSLVIPGLGWNHLANSKGGSSSDTVMFVLHLAATVGSIIAIQDGVRHDKPSNVAGGTIVLSISRVADLLSVTKAAADRRDQSRAEGKP